MKRRIDSSDNVHVAILTGICPLYASSVSGYQCKPFMFHKTTLNTFVGAYSSKYSSKYNIPWGPGPTTINWENS